MVLPRAPGLHRVHVGDHVGDGVQRDDWALPQSSYGVQTMYIGAWLTVLARSVGCVLRTGIRRQVASGSEYPEAPGFSRGVPPPTHAELFVHAVREGLHRWLCDPQFRGSLPIRPPFREQRKHLYLAPR